MALNTPTGTVITDSLIAVLDETYVKTMTVAALPPNAVGEVAGYTSGGIDLGSNTVNTIDKFPFSSPFATATDVGNLSVVKQRSSSQSSSTNGYVSGGVVVLNTKIIDKFPFSTPFVNATPTGELTVVKQLHGGQSSSTSGYVTGGTIPPLTNVIESFPFSTPFTTATDIGDLIQGRYFGTSQSSSTHGYHSGGSAPSSVNTIDRFPFSTPFTTATDVGDRSIIGGGTAGGLSSTDNGYSSGGVNFLASPPIIALIESFPFSTPFTIATNIGSLSQARGLTTGQSFISHGYTSGGSTSTPATVNTIDKFPFSTPFTPATDVGDLVQARYNSSGTQD